MNPEAAANPNQTPRSSSDQPLGSATIKATNHPDTTPNTSNEAINPAETTPPSPESDLAAQRAAAQQFLRRHGRDFSTFARDASLRYALSNDQTFSFDAKRFQVNVPVGWFANEAYTEHELQFVNYHELCHFIDMRRNPQAFLDNFAQMEQEATTLAQRYRQNHPGEPASPEAIKRFYYQQLHTLYNCLDDIYVNNLVARRSPFFDRGDGKASIPELYHKIGFQDPDLTKSPLHTQFAHSLLRDEMIGATDGESIVDDRVQTALSTKRMGQDVKGTINSKLKPQRGGILVDPAERYQLIRSYIQPLYLRLLEEALDQAEQQKQEQEQQQDESQDEQSEQDTQNDQSQNTDTFNPFGEGDQGSSPPDFINKGIDSERVARQILDSLKEADQLDKMSPEERRAHQDKKRQEEFDKEHDISPEQRQQNNEIQLQISRARHEMRAFWHRLVGKSVEYRTQHLPYQRRGRLNIDSTIRRWPEKLEAERQGNLRSLEIYDHTQFERSIVDQPEAIDVTLLVDCSGSMQGQGEEIARQTAALLMYSIKDFNDAIEATRHQTHTKLHANTEVIAFGSEFDTIKPFERGLSFDRNDANIIRALSKISSDRGSTDDAAPLTQIAQDLSIEQRTKIKAQKLKKIVFEITDGKPDNPEKTATRIKELAETGVITIGFQIGDVGSDASELFDEIWNSTNSPNSKGIYIGKDISTLPTRLMSELSKLLSRIRI